MRRDWRISPAEFESLVEEALAEIPREFLDLLKNIAVVVEEEPSDDDFDDDDDNELLGIYRGVSFSDTGDFQLPNEIAIFRGPILRIARSRRDAVEEIRDTVVHELGHHFGLDDDEMPY